MKRGRPSYATVGRKRGELKCKSDKECMNWLHTQLDNLNPGEYFRIPTIISSKLIESSVRSYLAIANRQKPLNLKLHVNKRKQEWMVWYCPDPYAKLTPHGNIIPASVGNSQPMKPIPRPKVSNSIYYPVADICQYLGITLDTFDSYTLDYQLQLRIKTGMKMRKERNQRIKLNKLLDKSNTPPTLPE
jgi:hypothetical protein